MSANILKLIIQLIIFSVVTIGSFVFVFRLKNVSKGYKIFFISYIIFWVPLKMLRDYTSIMQTHLPSDDTIIPLINGSISWLPLAAYGFVGIFMRPMADWLSLRLKNRKIILYLAIAIGISTFIPIIIHPSTTTNTIQSIGVGVGASMIGTYELMFKEQYTNNKSFLTVSIMAFPPLIADFVGAPIQSIVTASVKEVTAQNLSILWIVGIGFYLITFLILFFVKEDRNLVGIIKSNAMDANKKNNLGFFAMLCLVGFLISFVKFSNSGSIATVTIKNLAIIEKIPSDVQTNLTAYISTIFSLFQLMGTVFLGMFLIKKTNKLSSFSVGVSIWIIYQLIISFIQNPYVYFVSAALNGFAYGILYNLVLAYVLTLSFKNQKIAPMGIYQSTLSIGITASSFLVPFIKSKITDSDVSMIVNLSLLGGIILLELLFVSIFYLDKKIFIPKTQNINIKNNL